MLNVYMPVLQCIICNKKNDKKKLKISNRLRQFLNDHRNPDIFQSDEYFFLTIT
jgi:hypothetical protein